MADETRWKRATFKGKKVWVAVTPAGALDVQGGRVAMRYSEAAGAKLYRAGAGRVVLGKDAARSLPAGSQADASGASKGRSKRSSRGSGFGKAGTRSAAQAAMAADAARGLIAGLPPEAVLVFTDGACKGNPGPAGSGAVVQLPDGRVGEASLALGRGTNNVGELSAIGLALTLLDQAEVPTDAQVELLTDSSYSHGVLCKGWKAKANTALIIDLRQRLAARPGVTIRWIAGHVGIAGNERADSLANQGVAGVSATQWR